MTTTHFSHYDPTALIAGDFPLRTITVTIPAGANAAGAVLPRGTVLGETTSSSTFTTAISTATDGSQNPRCILAGDVDASAVAVQAPAYITGDFAFEELTVGAGVTLVSLQNAFFASNQSIFIRSVGTVA